MKVCFDSISAFINFSESIKLNNHNFCHNSTEKGIEKGDKLR